MMLQHIANGSQLGAAMACRQRISAEFRGPFDAGPRPLITSSLLGALMAGLQQIMLSIRFSARGS